MGDLAMPTTQAEILPVPGEMRPKRSGEQRLAYSCFRNKPTCSFGGGFLDLSPHSDGDGLGKVPTLDAHAENLALGCYITNTIQYNDVAQ